MAILTTPGVGAILAHLAAVEIGHRGMTLAAWHVGVRTAQGECGGLVVIEKRWTPGLAGMADFAAGFSAVTGKLASVHVFMAIAALRACLMKDDAARSGTLRCRNQLRFVAALAGSGHMRIL